MDSQDRPARDTYTVDYPRDVPSKGKTASERQVVCGGVGSSYRESRGNSENESPQEHMCILVLGPTGSGKSTFIAKASGMPDSARMIGHGLDSRMLPSFLPCLLLFSFFSCVLNTNSNPHPQTQQSARPINLQLHCPSLALGSKHPHPHRGAWK